AVGVVDFRLVQDFKEEFIGIAGCVMGGKIAPEHDEAIDGVRVVAQALFVVVLRKNCDLHSHAPREYFVDCAVKAGKEIGVEAVSVVRVLLERIGIDAEADIVEAELGHEGNIGRSGFGVGVLRGVVAGILREPDRSIDTVAEMLRSYARELRLSGAVLRSEKGRGEQNKYKQQGVKANRGAHA